MGDDVFFGDANALFEYLEEIEGAIRIRKNASTSWASTLKG